MKAVTVQFDNSGRKYKRMLRVLINSWEEHNPDIELQVMRVPAPAQNTMTKFEYACYGNIYKLAIWSEMFDQDCIFLDCDMLCMGEMASGFDLVEHVGITERSGSRFPFNGGVMYFKHTPYAKEFMEEFLRMNYEMFEDKELHRKWRAKYAGMNQSVIGYLYENGWKLDILPEMYNLCNSFGEWKDAKMIHIKSELRRYIMRRYINNGTFNEITKIWKSYE